MPFDEEGDSQPSLHSQKIGLKKVSTQESIFDSMPKKPTQEELNVKVRKVQDRSSANKRRAAELAMRFYKMMADKTLVQNKTSFQQDIELELLKDMINFGDDVNNDPTTDKESEGSISLIALLLKHSLVQRDRINKLEYMISQLEKKADLGILRDFISKEIVKVLDNNKKSE